MYLSMQFSLKGEFDIYAVGHMSVSLCKGAKYSSVTLIAEPSQY